MAGNGDGEKEGAAREKLPRIAPITGMSNEQTGFKRPENYGSGEFLLSGNEKKKGRSRIRF
jgi:hypothetical protein